MKVFNQGIRIISVALILFFLSVSVFLLGMPMALGTSLFCLLASSILYTHVSKIIKKDSIAA